MSVIDHQTAGQPGPELERWPALSPPMSSPIRAALARVFLRRVVEVAGLRVELPGGAGFGPHGAPAMQVHHPEAFFARLGQGGKIGFGESYMAKEWDAEDLVGVLEALARHADSLVPLPLQTLRRWYEARHPAAEDNDPSGAARNIVRHYDLSNGLFSAFLDQSMSYSSALFTGQHTSLEDAQAHKIERLLNASGVQRGTRLLEIGTGWGELSLRAARRGAQVTSVTLSQQQAALARQRIVAEGFGDMVDIQVQDYRDVVGTFDAIVSVEMIEAVGERWWPTYFRKLDECLAPGGRVGLQAITMAHERLLATKSSWTWIHKYIFPGGLIPSEQAMQTVMKDHTSLSVVDRLSFGQSYARTLACWQERFAERAAEIDHLGFDETFRRMWSFYLAYSEAGFRSGYLNVVQYVMSRGEEPGLSLIGS
jgi:cyclopropane-fatty-acyl-phospholipid synthase